MTFRVLIDGHPTLESEAWESVAEAQEFARNYNFFHQMTGSRAEVVAE